jgi:hypothetical protein
MWFASSTPVQAADTPLPVVLPSAELHPVRSAGERGESMQHEARRIAAVRTAPAVGLLQRACSCGGIPGPDGECAQCKAKRLQGESAVSMSGVPEEGAVSDDLAISICQPPGEEPVPAGGGPAKPPAASCPTSIKVAETTTVPLTDTQVGIGVRAGWGAITRMEVSGGGKTNWDGTKVKEKFGTQTNDCDTTPGCANTSGQGGNTGSTFTVGAASPAFKHPKLGEVVPAMPAKQNCFYDIMIQGGGIDWCAATGSCSRGCSQEYECGGNTFGSAFTVTWTYSKANHSDGKGGTVSVCQAAFTKT